MKRASAPSYDLFKTIVAIVLAVILLIMLLRGCAASPTALTQATDIVRGTATEVIPISGAVQSATQTPSPLPPTTAPTVTPTAIPPTATPTSAEVTQPTPTAAPDLATPTPALVQNTSCHTSSPSRLSVGQKARVIRRLNLRDEASIEASILRTNSLNTQVEIIGGPVCTPIGSSAYLWWQIRLADGTEGWSAETPLHEANYFLEPVP